VERLEQAQQPERERQEQAQAGDEPMDPLDFKLREALRLHALWLRNHVEGRRLDLGWLDLRGAIFRGADMRNADLSRAELAGAIGLPACPHIVSSDEGTSYCGLAEQQAQQQPEPAPSTPAGQGELVRSVALAIPNGSTHVDWTPEARRAILAVVIWLEKFEFVGAAADLLRREVGR
jgi:hypothetical protein